MKQVIAAVLLAALITGCAQTPKEDPSSPTQPESGAAQSEPSVSASEPEETQTPPEPDESDLIYERLYEKLLALDNPNCINLTNAQMLEDYDYLNQLIIENYPYIGVAKRKYGADWAKNYEEGRKRVEKCGSDAAFYVEVLKLVNSMKGAGHLSMFNPSRILAEQDYYRELQSTGSQEDLEYERVWMEDMLSPAVSRSAAAWDAMVTPLITEAIAEISPPSQDGEEDTEANVKTRILEEGKTAYVSIASFDMNAYEEDKQTLFAFYEQVADYDNLIIDITENGGGGMGYYYDLIVAPNIEQPVYWLDYVFAKDGPNNRRYSPDIEEQLLSVDATAEEIQKEVKESLPAEMLDAAKPLLDNLGIPPKMNRDDLKDLDFYTPSLNMIEPMGGGKLFKGRIWVLVSGNVYSSSESFASFCKDTGFATLVGTRTGGDGIGSTPLFFVLPNSGMLGRYSMMYGTTRDGTGSEEFGTEPDFVSAGGETPLDTCLAAIEAHM